jgi:uncharacterized 2Fe-2S/4Fe-4S cluster protein (DUF4445 family)
MGNAAALGAQMALLSETERKRAFELAQRIEHVALAACPEFLDIFVGGTQFGSRPTDEQMAKLLADTIAARMALPKVVVAGSGK